MAATVAEVDSMAGAEATDRPRPRGAGDARTRSKTVLADGRGSRPAIRASSEAIGSRREADAYLATAACSPRAPRGSRRPGGLGGARASAGRRSRTRTRWPGLAGARRRRSSAAARVARRGRGRGRRSRKPRSSGSASPPGRSSASCASSARRAMIQLPAGVEELVRHAARSRATAIEPVAVGPGLGAATARTAHGHRRGPRPRSSGASSARPGPRAPTPSGCRGASTRCSR